MSGDRRDASSAAGNGKVNGNGFVAAGESGKQASATVLASVTPSQRLRLYPNKDHKPETYQDLQLDFTPSVFSSLERYLPPSVLGLSRDDEAKFMREILLKYLPHAERVRVCSTSFFPSQMRPVKGD